VASYVLQEFRSSEMEAINKAIEESLGIVESCLALGLDKALSGSRL
jgi:peptidyl-tRNA hydrolase